MFDSLCFKCFFKYLSNSRSYYLATFQSFVAYNASTTTPCILWWYILPNQIPKIGLESMLLVSIVEQAVPRDRDRRFSIKNLWNILAALSFKIVA